MMYQTIYLNTEQSHTESSTQTATLPIPGQRKWTAVRPNEMYKMISISLIIWDLNVFSCQSCLPNSNYIHSEILSVWCIYYICIMAIFVNSDSLINSHNIHRYLSEIARHFVTPIAILSWISILCTYEYIVCIIVPFILWWNVWFSLLLRVRTIIMH